MKNVLKTRCHFPGITILLPLQGEKEIVAVDKGSIPENIPDQPDIFIQIRRIANIALYYKEDVHHQDPVTTFNPPIEVRVGYNFYDVVQSHFDVNQLKLAYWDGSQNCWVIISDPAKDFDYLILPPDTGQVAEFKIWSWTGDPPLAWGR
jgi:hypothetical protein